MNTPRPPHRPISGAAAPYGLASTMLRVTVAELAEAGRNVRGRRLQDQRAVLWLHVAKGVVTGEVQGSQRDPYQVRWTSRPISSLVETERRQLALDNPVRATRLVPAGRDLSARCDCADDTDVCKHAVAVLLELADDIATDAEPLALWRGIPLDATGPVLPDDPDVRHETPPAPRAPRAPRDRLGTPAAIRPVVDPLADQLVFPDGARLLAGRPRITPLPPPSPRGPDDLTREVLLDALVWMQEASPW